MKRRLRAPFAFVCISLPRMPIRQFVQPFVVSTTAGRSRTMND